MDGWCGFLPQRGWPQAGGGIPANDASSPLFLAAVTGRDGHGVVALPVAEVKKIIAWEAGR